MYVVFLILVLGARLFVMCRVGLRAGARVVSFAPASALLGVIAGEPAASVHFRYGGKSKHRP